MVSYTSSSTILGGEVVELIEHFESESRQAITQAGGRVVKTLGDAVLYIADDLETGLNVIFSLIERLNADDTILPVRASFVRGDVFSRSGDVFGPTVNLASRLVDIAPVGQILTDPATATAVASKAGDGYRLEEFPSADLHGFGLADAPRLGFARFRYEAGHFDVPYLLVKPVSKRSRNLKEIILKVYDGACDYCSAR